MAAIVNDATHTISLGMGSHKLRQLRNEIFTTLGPREVIAGWKFASEIHRLHRHLYHLLWMRTSRGTMRRYISALKMHRLKVRKVRWAFVKEHSRCQARAFIAWCQTRQRLAKFSNILLRSTYTIMRNAFRLWRIQTEIMLKFPHYVEILSAVIKRKEIQDTAILFHRWQSYCHSQSRLESIGRTCQESWEKCITRRNVRFWLVYARKHRGMREQAIIWSASLVGKFLRIWNLHARFATSNHFARALFFRNQQRRCCGLHISAWLEYGFDVRMQERSHVLETHRNKKVACTALHDWYNKHCLLRRMLTITRVIEIRHTRQVVTNCLSSWMQFAKVAWNK